MSAYQRPRTNPRNYRLEQESKIVDALTPMFFAAASGDKKAVKQWDIVVQVLKEVSPDGPDTNSLWEFVMNDFAHI